MSSLSEILIPYSLFNLDSVSTLIQACLVSGWSLLFFSKMIRHFLQELLKPDTTFLHLANDSDGNNLSQVLQNFP